jgi:DNA-directed RNA polymerase specialized sigma24 family protein
MERSSESAGSWKGAAFRRTLLGIVRKRVPERDVEDIVQATLAEALSPTAPTADDALQRWLVGVAKHKIADRHRRGQRESFDLPELQAEAAPHSGNDLVRWAERALPAEGEEPRRTFEWMLREGEGEKLESIAESEQIPGPRVRKRVSRLRRHLRAEWKKEVALLAALGIVAVLVVLARRGPREPIAHDRARPVPSEVVAPEERARHIREDALTECDELAWVRCVAGLDRAREMDPSGDAAPRVVAARAAADAALNPAPSPAPRPPSRVAPSPSSAPVPPPASTPTAPSPRKAGHSQKTGGSL